MTVPDAPIAANLNETLDVKVNLLSKLTLNLILVVDELAETVNLIFA